MTQDWLRSDDWQRCWQCEGVGMMPGRIRDACACGFDPGDVTECCAPSRCDICGGDGGWYPISDIRRAFANRSAH